METQVKIKDEFITYLLENGHYPASIYAFAKQLGISEADFYESYNSFEQIEAEIWQDLVSTTIAAISAEEVYANYSVREKLLSFYFTFVERAKAHRSYLLQTYAGFQKPLPVKNNTKLSEAKSAFIDFANNLLAEARETREIEQRALPQIMQAYPGLLWKQFLSILEFWFNDKSIQFEKTDTLIEKSVNTAFDLMGRTPFDSLFDLGKFMFQNRK